MEGTVSFSFRKWAEETILQEKDQKKESKIMNLHRHPRKIGENPRRELKKELVLCNALQRTNLKTDNNAQQVREGRATFGLVISLSAQVIKIQGRKGRIHRQLDKNLNASIKSK